MMPDKYFNVLCSLVKTDLPQYSAYHKLLAKLYSERFTWILPMDQNRALAGLRLRDIYGYVSDEPCSILEMLIALSQDCEIMIMQEDEMGDRTFIWFWDMIQNLGLLGMSDYAYDEDFVNYSLDIFLNRKYDRHGRGGIFYVERPRRDMRKVELWYQMNWYLSENFDPGVMFSRTN